MTDVPGGYEGEIKTIAHLEKKLAAVLMTAADEINHMEWPDQEQRAEVYAILDALKADTEIHQAVVGRWINDRTGEVSDV